ncbi:hypothetical protein N7489_001598 [Penicillium chrysogenum]|uniref:uncharacterized protein n=1 Tax=Penicillium chrysogenum TaxID=5076 RepID=UPI0023908702|nr:uncharacterized protein N7489_001598 [Penicillium chrysogenum]KAJ5251188.1 hypothetical protein N7489_001598 [Penicillium chrysogenum]KAJ5262624.1 hypothetical protein N7524_007929 [Penicillium chrysogenum]
MAIQPLKLFHQHILSYLTLAIDKIFSSITITTKQLKAKYQARVQANGFKLLLRELREAEHARIQLDWISEHRQEIRRVNNIIQRETHIGSISRHYEIQVQHESPSEPSTLKKLHECNFELRLLNIEYFQHLERMAELMERKPPGRLVHRSGISNGPTANSVAAAALVSVVAANDLGRPFGTLLARFDICTAQAVVDVAPATVGIIPQLW